MVIANLKKGKEAQSIITVKWSGESEYNRDEIVAMKALLEVLNIKIIEKLREELGGMYSGNIYGSMMKRPYGHSEINATVPCGPENVEKLTAALFELIKNTSRET